MRISCWFGACVVLTATCGLYATRTYHSAILCRCNGRSPVCILDDVGLHCVDCQGNTEGRHCQRCKAGFYRQGAAGSCEPCHCHPTGSVDGSCDSRGRCSCRERVTGEKCDRCPDGTMGPGGCAHSRQSRQDPGRQTPPCFCYGHSSTCSDASGYSVHNISSTFSHGFDGWTIASSLGVTPAHVHFRWSPTHGDVEVISKNSLPVYLYAPDRYLGNQLFSYGQNLSFALRLDRGVRHPSTNDVILEGGGLRVSASLGDLRSLVPCGQKIRYSFRLDEQPGSKWRPQLSPVQFQTLLQNLTAIKIRATFGDNGRGYLDNVNLVSARHGPGDPARWVRTCVCPAGYEGEFCQHCSAGFRRKVLADGSFSPCEPCSCSGTSCDPLTGDCYSADETTSDRTCEPGFYRDARKNCVRCPCPVGVACSVPTGSQEPRCDPCPIGTTGRDCDVCEEGYYGAPCRPCQCNGHIDVGVSGSCDRRSGVCLKCLNNTRGRRCDECLSGFYHQRLTDACKPCNCDLRGSESLRCDDVGQCRCRSGFEGERCQRVSCPTCFDPVKTQVEDLLERLKNLENLLSEADGGLSSAVTESALRSAEQLLKDLQENTEELSEAEKALQRRLSSVSLNHLDAANNLQNTRDDVDALQRQQDKFSTEAQQVQNLLSDMRRKLEQAKDKLGSADVPMGDGATPPSSDVVSSLLKTATKLADRHQDAADSVEEAARSAQSDSEKSLDLVRSLMNRENRGKSRISELQSLLEQISDRVSALEDQASDVSDSATNEIKKSNELLVNIANLGENLPASLKGPLDALVTRLDDVKKDLDQNLSDLDTTRDKVQKDSTAAQDLLAKGKSDHKKVDELIDRVDVAKADTEDALRRINTNMADLDDALKTIKGFDQEIDRTKALADDAIKRLPGINATIMEAVKDNAETMAVLENVTSDYNDALGLVGQLKNLVNGLEGDLNKLPHHTNLYGDATKLHTAAKDLKKKAVNVSETLKDELDSAQKLEDDAQQAVLGAEAASDNARAARDAVGRTLQDVNDLLDSLNQPGTKVDEDRLRQLEEALAKAEDDVNNGLRPRLDDMEQLENAARRRLGTINVDIDTILENIANLEDILSSIPPGCYDTNKAETP